MLFAGIVKIEQQLQVEGRTTEWLISGFFEVRVASFLFLISKMVIIIIYKLAFSDTWKKWKWFKEYQAPRKNFEIVAKSHTSSVVLFSMIS